MAKSVNMNVSTAVCFSCYGWSYLAIFFLCFTFQRLIYVWHVCVGLYQCSALDSIRMARSMVNLAHAELHSLFIAIVHLTLPSTKIAFLYIHSSSSSFQKSIKRSPQIAHGFLIPSSGMITVYKLGSIASSPEG